ncbi:MAG: hypothetical protein DGJ47_000076 [Rickettsiaceae bacterium]
MILNLIKFLLRNFILLVTVGFITLATILFYYSRDLPNHDKLKQYYPASITRLYSSDGKLIEEYAREKRVFIPIDSIPKQLVQAFVAVEDKNFYTHEGIDFLSIIRAAGTNVTNILKGKRVEGASTITQQVVKNFLLSSERSLDRKIKEAILSYRITQVFSKDKVMELYLNQIFLGKGSYGVAMASLNYFNKSIEELTLSECAILASLPKAPSKFNPARNYERAMIRKNYVLDRMHEEGFISFDQLQEAKEENITLKKRDKVMTIDADYYASKVRQEVISMFNEEYFYTAGLTIITCLDSNIQKGATESLRYGIKKYDMKRGYRGPIAKQIELDNWQENLSKIKRPVGLLHYKLAVILSVDKEEAEIGLKNGAKSKIYLKDAKWTATNITSLHRILKQGQVVTVEKKGQEYQLQQIPDVNGGLMVMDHNTGRVLAIQGGYDFDSSRYDRTTQAVRQVGSSIKPFIYLAALESGAHPTDIFEDAPIAIEQGPGLPLWEPRNYERNFLGPMTLRQGLAKSRNTVTVRVSQFAGLDNIRELIKRFGVNDNPPPYHSIVLGALETTLSRMTNATGQIANGGYKIDPHYIELIKDRFGNVIYKRDYSECVNCSASEENFEEDELPKIHKSQSKRIIDSATNYQMISLMRGGVERGTSRGAKRLKQIVAGKTGTTNDAKDTWFMGFTPKIVVGTYIGYDQPRSLGNRVSGATVALPVFVHFMQNTYINEPSVDFDIPDSVYTKKIDPESGEFYDGPGSINEAFKKDGYNDSNLRGGEYEINIDLNTQIIPDAEEQTDDDLFDKIEDYDQSQEIY